MSSDNKIMPRTGLVVGVCVHACAREDVCACVCVCVCVCVLCTLLR